MSSATDSIPIVMPSHPPSQPSSPTLSSISFATSAESATSVTHNATSIAQVPSVDGIKVNGFDIADGNLLLKTEDVIHRVHWSLLQRHSKYFVDLHLARGGAKNVIMLEGIKANDFLHLLSIVYPSDLDACSLTSKDDWASVLHLSHELCFPTARKLAIRMLFPLASPIDKIVYGHRYNICEWLLDAYVAICEREALISIEEGQRLGVTDVVTITHARHELQSRSMTPDDVRYIVWRACCSSLVEAPKLVELQTAHTAQAESAQIKPSLTEVPTTEWPLVKSSIERASIGVPRALSPQEEIKQTVPENEEVKRESQEDYLSSYSQAYTTDSNIREDSGIKTPSKESFSSAQSLEDAENPTCVRKNASEIQPLSAKGDDMSNCRKTAPSRWQKHHDTSSMDIGSRNSILASESELEGGSKKELQALRDEIKALKDANRALSLYSSKIIDRIITQEGFDHILTVDYEPSGSTTTTTSPAARPNESKEESSQSLTVGHRDGLTRRRRTTRC